MLHIIAAAVRPAATYGAVQTAAIPTEPQALAIYILLAWSFFAVWVGNRNSDSGEGEAPETDEGDDDPRSAEGDDGSAQPAERNRRAERRRTGGRKLSRAQRRKRGHIDWIQ